MTESGDARRTLEYLSAIFIRCFGLAVALLVLWLCIVLIAGNWAFSVHSSMFELDRHDFELMNYYGMALVKLTAFLFFLVPYISIRMVLRKRESP